MSALGIPRRYCQAELSSICQPNHSGIKELDAHAGIYEASEQQAVIRYQYPLGEDGAGSEIFVNFSFSLKTTETQATHISVVNNDVSHGCIWNINADTGRFTLNGIIKSPNRLLTIYLNLSGRGQAEFLIESLVVVEVNQRRPLRLGFIIDPWTERNDPAWKADYIWWFGKMDQALRNFGRKVDSCYVFSDGVAPLWPKFKPNDQARHAIVKESDLKAIYPETREGIRAQRTTSLKSQDCPTAKLRDIISRCFPWEPDIIVSLSDMQIIKDAFPESLVLFRDAIYCREPFPDELTSLDDCGLYKNSSLSEYCRDYDPELSVNDDFLNKFFRPSTEIENLLSAALVEPGQFLLLPLQDSRYYNFFDECEYSRQSELVEAAAQMFSNQKILVTQHPEHREIDLIEISELCRRFPNLLYFPQLEKLKNPTAQLLRYSSGMIGVSTGLIYQAILCGVPVHFLGEHALREILVDVTDRTVLRAIAFNFMTRYFFSVRYLHDGAWLAARVCSLALKRENVLHARELMIDMPSNVFSGLISDMRPVGAPDDAVSV